MGKFINALVGVAALISMAARNANAGSEEEKYSGFSIVL